MKIKNIVGFLFVVMLVSCGKSGDKIFRSKKMSKRSVLMAEIASLCLDYSFLKKTNENISSKLNALDAYIDGDLYLVNPRGNDWDSNGSVLVVCVLSKNKYLILPNNLPSIDEHPPKWLQKKLNDKKRIEYLKKHEKKKWIPPESPLKWGQSEVTPV